MVHESRGPPAGLLFSLLALSQPACPQLSSLFLLSRAPSIWTNLNLGSIIRSKLLFRLGLASDSQLDLFLSSQYYLTLRLLVYLALLVYTYLTDYGYARRYRTDSHLLGTFAEEVPLSKCHATA